jgi:hypothetical protein
VTVAGKFWVTPHAVHRYIERVHRGIDYDRALSEIVDASETAHYVKDYNGGQYWRCSRSFGRLRLLVNDCFDGLPQIVTILSASDKSQWPRRLKLGW